MSELENELLRALKAVTAELAPIVKEEGCDHAVGICWCSAREAVEDAEDAIRKAESAR